MSPTMYWKKCVKPNINNFKYQTLIATWMSLRSHWEISLSGSPVCVQALYIMWLTRAIRLHRLDFRLKARKVCWFVPYSVKEKGGFVMTLKILLLSSIFNIKVKMLLWKCPSSIYGWRTVTNELCYIMTHFSDAFWNNWMIHLATIITQHTALLHMQKIEVTFGNKHGNGTARSTNINTNEMLLDLPNPMLWK